MRSRGEPLEVRCSALPLAFACPGSVRPEGLALNEGGAEAELGTAAHDGLAELAERGRVDWNRADDLARRHRVEPRDLRALLALGAALWREVGGLFPAPDTELELTFADPGGAFVITGHADLLAWDRERRVVRIGDWKTGRRDADYREQLLGYCALALAVAGFEALDTARAEAFALWVRDGEIERHTMSGRLVAAWLARVQREIVDWDGRYRVGPHCEHCPRSHECPAGRALVRRDVARLIADAELVERLEGDGLETLPPAEIVALLERADLAAAVAGRVRAAIRRHVQRSGDVVAGGRRLTLEHAERRSLDVRAALPVLAAAGLSGDDLLEAVEVSLAEAERIVASRAGRGHGAGARRELTAALEAAGAIETTATVRLVVKRDT